MVTIVVPSEELLLRARPPAWPTARPAIPSMCCRDCLRMSVYWVWRLARSLHLLVLESYDDADQRDEALPGAGAAREGVATWPWCLPDALLCAADFEAAEEACKAVAVLCQDIVTAMDDRRQELPDGEDRQFVGDVCWHVNQSVSTVLLLAGCITSPPWKRWRALQLADAWVERMTELFVGWPPDV